MAMSIDTEISRRATESIAQLALTNSKRPESFVKGVYPTHLKRASGCHSTDTLGRRYVDYICGLGTNLLGWGNQPIAEVVEKAYASGVTLSLSTVEEIELAEKVKEIMPFVERIKVFKTGSEGCTAAVRIARAFTGKKVVLRDGYAGWHDEMISLMQPALGVVGDYKTEKLNCLDDIPGAAAVLLEPIITDFSQERIKYLQMVREACTKHNVVLIFDETITALRFPKFCVANWCGVQPDLIIFGKALGAGFPISVVGGKKEIMNCGEYFTSGSFNGERVSLAAAIKTIQLLQTRLSLQELWDAGSYFIKQFNQLELGVTIEGYPTRGVLKGDPLSKALFMQEACKAGLLFGASWFFCFPHRNETDGVLATLKDVSMKLKIGKVRLEGEMPRSPFAQQMREVKK